MFTKLTALSGVCLLAVLLAISCKKEIKEESQSNKQLVGINPAGLLQARKLNLVLKQLNRIGSVTRFLPRQFLVVH